MRKVIVLDLDGPLLDGRFRHHACYSDILRDLGHQPLPLDPYWEMKRQRKDRHELLAASGAGEHYREFLRRWLETIETPPYLAMDRVQAGVHEKLNQWRTQQYFLILATQRQNSETLTDQLEQTGLAKLLDRVVVSPHGEGADGKARRARDAAPESPSDQWLWIGDTEIDIEAARLLGCPVWTLTCGIRTEPFLRDLRPDFVSEYLSEIELEDEP